VVDGIMKEIQMREGIKRRGLTFKLITIVTFEEKIDEIIKANKELADLTAATGEKWITELSNKDLKEILSLSKG